MSLIKYIPLFQPDIVIFEVVERKLQESTSGVDDERVLRRMDDPEEEMALKAVLNQKEYYAWRDEERFCFTFRRWDLDRNAQICFYKCFDLNY